MCASVIKLFSGETGEPENDRGSNVNRGFPHTVNEAKVFRKFSESMSQWLIKLKWTF